MPRSAKKISKKNKKIFKLFALSILVAGIAIFGQRYSTFNSIDTNPPQILGKTTNFISVDKDINLAATNTATSPIVTAKILSAELTDELVIGGKKSVASEGKIFLILETKLSGTQNSDTKINLSEAIKIKQSAKLPTTAIYPTDPIVVSQASETSAKIIFSLTKPLEVITLLARTEPFVYTVLPLHND